MIPAGKTHSIAFVATYPPALCGIGTFTSDLVDACRGQMDERLNPLVVAINDRKKGYDYPPEVEFDLDKHTRPDYVRAAEFLNYHGVRAVSLQHEFGIFGGPDGSYVLDMVRELRCPLVTHFHTVLKNPSEGQRAVMKELIVLSNQVVVMSELAVEFLQEVYDAPPEKIQFVHHGVPSIPLVEPDNYKSQFDLEGRRVILTFGLLSPGKGIEYMLDALPQVVERYPNVTYVVLGATHPGVLKDQGESYRISLQRKARNLGLQKNVLFQDRFVSLDELCEFLKAADLYVTPYLNREQITSGTLAYALSAGKPIISTRYWYAEELLAHGRGKLVDCKDSAQIRDALLELLGSPHKVREIRSKAYEFARQMTWSRVGDEYLDVCRSAIHTARVRTSVPDASMRHIVPMTSLPEPRLEHLLRLTDDTGILQHARFSVPNRHFGYCTDDNARGLVVAAKHYRLFRDERAEDLLSNYLSFVQFAQREDGLFHNFMNYSRQFLDEVGSDDCFGRALWGLGYVTHHAPSPYDRLAKAVFEKGLKNLSTMNLRGRSYSMVGLYHYLQRYAEATDIIDKIDRLAEVNAAQYKSVAERDSGWCWFEPAITYDSAVIPQCLFLAYEATGKEDYLEIARESLDFLIGKCRRNNHFSFVGNEGWHQKGEEPALYDQQPIDAAGYVEACKAAFRHTGDRQYLRHMRMAFDWFLGANDQSQVLFDFKTGGCADGLTAHGANENQGAESTLCCMLALLTLTELYSEQERIVTVG